MRIKVESAPFAFRSYANKLFAADLNEHLSGRGRFPAPNYRRKRKTLLEQRANKTAASEHHLLFSPSPSSHFPALRRRDKKKETYLILTPPLSFFFNEYLKDPDLQHHPETINPRRRTIHRAQKERTNDGRSSEKKKEYRAAVPGTRLGASSAHGWSDARLSLPQGARARSRVQRVARDRSRDFFLLSLSSCPPASGYPSASKFT